MDSTPMSPEEREFLSAKGKSDPRELSEDELQEAHGAGVFSTVTSVLGGAAGGPGGAIAGYVIGDGIENPDPAY